MISYLQAWWPEETSKATFARLMIEWGLPSNFMMNGMARTSCPSRLQLHEVARAQQAGP